MSSSIPRLMDNRIARQLGPVLAPLVLFLLLASVELSQPGLHYDEALEAGLPALQLLQGRPVRVPPGGALQLAGWSLPLMVQNHIGALQVYAALPFVLIGGPHAASLRAMTVLLGALTILAVYLFLLQLYGRRAALYGSLWLACFGSFVFWARQGVFVTSLAGCFAAWGLAFGARWWRQRALWAAGLAGLCAGLAIYSKLSALWLLNGVIGWWIVCSLVARLRARADAPGAIAGQPWRAIGVALGGLLLGSWPVLLYNLRTGAATLNVIERSAEQTYLGTDNTAVLANLQVRLQQAADVVRSGGHLWYLGGVYPNSIALVAVLASVLILALGALRQRGDGWRTLLFIPFLALLVILQSCYTISALWPTHFAVAATLPAMLFGIAAAQVTQLWPAGRLRPGRWPGWLLGLLALLVLASQTLTSLRYLHASVTSGGYAFHSAAIYELTTYLERQQRPVVALDWGFAAQLEYLSGGALQVEERFQYQQSPAAPAALVPQLSPDVFYLTHAPGLEGFPVRDSFIKAATLRSLRAERVLLLPNPEGLPLLEVWRLRELP